MKILLGHAIILGFMLSFCCCYNFSPAVDPYHKEIYNFVKQIVTDWNQKHEKDINDISIVNMDNDTSLLHIVRKAIPKDQTVLLPNCSGFDLKKYEYTRKSSLFIIISKILGDMYTYANKILGCIEAGFWTPQTNILVIPIGNVKDISEISYPYRILISSRTVNFVIPYIHNDKIVGLYKSKTLKPEDEPDILAVTTNTDLLFDDKLVDMKGYAYKAIVNKNDKGLVMVDDKLIMTEIRLMETIAEKQNASLSIQLSDIELTKELEFALEQGTVDMVLNFGYYSGLLGNEYFIKTVNTFEMNGYCALVPIPYTHQMFLRFVIHPFSNSVWFITLVSVAFGALVWNGFRKLSEGQIVPGHYLVYDVLSVFVQQSINVRKGRTLLRLMLQFLIFMMIILANLYQGTITSILMRPKIYKKIENIQELQLKGHEFHTDQLFLRITNVSEAEIYKYRIKPLDIWLHNSNYIKQFQDFMTVNPNNVLITACDIVTELLETQIDKDTKAYNVYYQFHQKILSYYKNILLTRRSPFYEKLSEMSLRIHESGIKQHWDLLMSKGDIIQKSSASMLGIKEMLSVFKLYYIAITAICLIFMLELSKNYVRLIYHRLFKRCMRCVQRYCNRKIAPRMQKVGNDGTSRVEMNMRLQI